MVFRTSSQDLTLLADAINFSVEDTPESVVVTYNTHVAGKGTKPTGLITEHLVPA